MRKFPVSDRIRGYVSFADGMPERKEGGARKAKAGAAAGSIYSCSNEIAGVRNDSLVQGYDTDDSIQLLRG
jgi:hypothetical protein